jgi:FtsH-binding integral membrane protein
MNRDARHWANNCAGIFLVSVVMLVAAWAGGKIMPGSGGFAVTLLWVLLVASLGGWMFFAFKAGQRVLDKTFPRQE